MENEFVNKDEKKDFGDAMENLINKGYKGEELIDSMMQYMDTPKLKLNLKIPDSISGVKISGKMKETLIAGGTIQLEGLTDKNTGEKYNPYVSYDFEKDKLSFSRVMQGQKETLTTKPDDTFTSKLDWKEIKAKVSILQVATDLGYKPVHDKTTSLRPVLRNVLGDTIIIKNPTDPANQQFRNPNNDNDKGSVIDFVKQRLNDFPVATGKNELDKLNNVLRSFINVPFDLNKLNEKLNISSQKLFDSNNYPNMPAGIKDLGYLIKERNISVETLNAFLPFIHVVSNNQNSAFSYKNIGFPYTVPGEDKIRGYELRNYNFRSFSTGGDKINAVWQASCAPDKSMVKNIYVAESAIDAMSYFELNKSRLETNNSVFVSTGGTLLSSQINNLKKEYPNGIFHGCFDRDLAGNLYDITLACAVESKTLSKIYKDESIEFRVDGKTFELSKVDVTLDNFLKEAGFTTDNVKSHKPVNAKDFNEVLSKKNENTTEKKPVFKR